MLNQVRTAIVQLQTAGRQITLRAIAKQANVPASWIYYYPAIHETCCRAVEHYGSIQPSEHEAALLLQVRSATESLQSEGVSVSLAQVAKRIHWSRNTLSRYPTVIEFLRKVCGQSREVAGLAYEDAAVERTQAAIDRLMQDAVPLTAQVIADEVGVPPALLEYYPRVQVACPRGQPGYRPQSCDRASDGYDR